MSNNDDDEYETCFWNWNLSYENKRLITLMILLFFSFNFWYVNSLLKSVKEVSEIYDIDIDLQTNMIWKKTCYVFYLCLWISFHDVSLDFCIPLTYCIGAMNTFFQPSGSDIYSTTEINIRYFNLDICKITNLRKDCSDVRFTEAIEEMEEPSSWKWISIKYNNARVDESSRWWITALFTSSSIHLHTRGIIKFFSTANQKYNFHRLSNKNEGHT